MELTGAKHHQEDDQHWMAEALKLAERADSADEVPVGAVVVKDGQIIGRGFNQPISGCDPTAHAEIVALRDAARKLGNYRLTDCTLYVTVEPCTMCAGATVHARISRLVFGAREPKAGAIESRNQLLEHPAMNYRVEVSGGILQEQCAAKMSAFFQRRRQEKKSDRQAASE